MRHERNVESRSGLSNRTSTLEFQQNLSILEQEWNTADGSSSPSSLFEVCRCCGKECDNLDYFKKLESDTRLAAEIGQGLLHKHETYVSESNIERTQLENQLQECHEKIGSLEQQLDQAENQKDLLLEEKNKWLWKYQKKQKILDETLSDLELTSEKCNQLSNELQEKISQVEKLRIFKFMVRQAETREETLNSKLEDTNQELAVCRKNELVLESKMKKLKMRYESLYNSHEQLTRDLQEKINHHGNHNVHNNNNNNNNNKIISSAPLQHHYHNDDYINLIKELSMANTKLKTDLSNTRQELTESKGELLTTIIQQQQEEEEQDEYNQSIPIQIKNDNIPTPIISSSMPTSTTTAADIVHHHYHYYVNKKEEEQEQEQIILSPSTSSILTVKPSESPYILVQQQVSQLLERLRGSDIRQLNRKLKRAFDITEISSMSNSVIENILIDVANLDTRFLSVTSEFVGFFPLLDLFKDLLNEVGVQRMTMNELQVEYVVKIQESELKVEEEIIRKRQEKKLLKQQATTNNSLSWLTNLFNTSSNTMDQESTLTKSTTTTDCATLIPATEDTTTTANNTMKSAYPPLIQQPRNNNKYKQQRTATLPVMKFSHSTGTTTTMPISMRSSNNKRRMHIEFEGIVGLPTTDSNKVNFSSSWLGGK